MTTTTNTIGPAQKVTVLKHALADRGTEFISTVTRLTQDQVAEILLSHGGPDKDRMKTAIATLEKQAEGDLITTKPLVGGPTLLDGSPRPTPRPTLRPAQRAETPAAAAAPPPVVEQPVDDKPEPYIAALPVSQLFADDTYQRDLDELRVQRMAAGFRIALVGIIEVSKRADDAYAILDGQHRWALLRDVAFNTDNEDPHVACRVHEQLTIAEEAALYHQLNTTRKQLTGWDRWLARRGAGEQLVLDIEACAARHGLEIGMHAGGTILRATKACENVVDLGGIALLDQTLHVVRAAYQSDQAGLDGAILHGVGNVLRYYAADEYDMSRLVEALSGIVPRQLTARAAAVRELHKGTMDRLTAHVIVERYNGTKGPKLEAFFERVKPVSKTKTVKFTKAEKERQAMLAWAKRTNWAGRHDRMTPSLRAAYAEAHPTGSAA